MSEAIHCPKCGAVIGEQHERSAFLVTHNCSEGERLKEAVNHAWEAYKSLSEVHRAAKQDWWEERKKLRANLAVAGEKISRLQKEVNELECYIIDHSLDPEPERA
jgi:uncharacterized Zn finger protein (UPF0148 family)